MDATRTKKRVCVLIALACVTLAAGWAPSAGAAGAKPNIIFILTDDLSWNLVQYMPNLLAMQNEHLRMRAQSVLAIDKMIGQIRSTLAGLGLDNTYVVFSSDNGLHMGEYSLRPGKMTPFDIDVPVPLIVVGPGVPKGQAVSAIAENVDLCPTFTELGGASSPTSPDGQILVPLLRGNPVAD